MSDEIRELRNEIIALKENVDKLEGKNAELSKENDKLIEENVKLKEEIETLKAEKSQQNAANSTIAIPSTSQQPIKRPPQEEESSDFAPNIKRPKRFIQNWLIDSLPWIGREEMAISSLSTSSEIFRQLCWPKLHNKVKPRKIPYLKFTKVDLELGNVRALIHTEKQIVPIASIQPLDYILGIGTIDLEFVNDQVLNFFKNTAHLLQNCTLYFVEMNEKEDVSSMRTLLEFLADKIFKFIVDQNLIDFNQLFPDIFDHIQSLQFGKYEDNDDFWEDMGNYEGISIILDWLTKQSNYGKQKTIEFGFIYNREYMTFFIKQIKEEFLHSNSPSIFLIFYSAAWVYEEFTLENANTNEILTLYRKMDSLFYLARYPKGQEHWKKDGKNKIHQMMPNSTIINIL